MSTGLKKDHIESGQDVKETITPIAGDATEKALEKDRFTADRVKTIAEKVLSGAVEAAEETGILPKWYGIPVIGLYPCFK